ncbi:DUF1398 family protein [Legionella feeleii]|uniref:Phage envelope protein n=1 Tax=Legionella feeleii TaxID=453 RepID=A0A378IQQ6_9GAMM|nr:DUF1398 family protein [Legionella feeleii]STX37568.1 Phage envelope protein [Legionella feeleii]
MKPSTEAIAFIKQSLDGCFNNTIIFPEHVKKLAEMGVIRYEVDLKANHIDYYFNDKTTHREEIALTLAAMNNNFDKESVQKTISAIQQQMIDYPTLLKRIVAAGTQKHVVDIIAQQVIYLGKEEQLIEDFPKTEQKRSIPCE